MIISRPVNFTNSQVHPDDQFYHVKRYTIAYAINRNGEMRSISPNFYGNSRKLDFTGKFPRVHLYYLGKSSSEKVAHLVAEQFMDNPYSYKYLTYIDGNLHNIHADNLYWDNRNSSKIQSTVSYPVRSVSQYTLDSEYIDSYASITIASERTGVTHPSIVKCAKGKLKTAGNFIWKYSDT